MQKVFLFITIILFALQIFAQETEPKVVKAFAPESISVTAKSVRAVGEVIIRIEVDSEGNVISAKAVSGHRLLLNSSIEAAKKWKFSINTLQEKSLTEIKFDYSYNFVQEKVIEGAKSGLIVELNSKFVEPNQMKVFLAETILIPKIKLLPRIDDKLEEKYCEIHKVKMQTEIVDIIYGLTMPNKGFEDIYKVEEKLFPNANFELHAGCIPEPAEQSEVYYCD
ncbi:MAG: energy transducer TonB [Pyrinomonadaceae bacterium]|nr:energy transducer TonB [Pyrinomonadaceae bacterium]